MFPGSNLLNEAFQAIDQLTIQWHRYLDRTLSPARVWISGYAPSVPVRASVQAVNRARYADMGLDYSKTYAMLYMSQNARGLSRDDAPDRFVLPNGRTYEVVSEDDWFGEDGNWTQGINGWVGVLVVRLGKDAKTNVIEPEPEP
jgi:hypothetical protein